ncbi:hypothetical protein WS72_23130 [Burkholderia savannae]|uniref:Uncharacterized protein n=1 Tax=Burkholderia savannae TaxID=1637837 RepID=A0ABR5T3L4_9BURK|nr:hypothetical protein WS72_23130 [Burkholderia savannae]
MARATGVGVGGDALSPRARAWRSTARAARRKRMPGVGEACLARRANASRKARGASNLSGCGLVKAACAS